MDKKITGIIAVLIVLVAVIGAIAFATKNKDSNDNKNQNTNTTNSNVVSREIINSENPDIIIYYGKGCPHCTKVEEYIKASKADEKVKLAMKEIWYDKENASEMNTKADICKVNKDELGVPFMYSASNSKCYTGDQDIIDYLKNASAAADLNSANTNVNAETNQ